MKKNNFFKIYSGDYTKDGYDKGIDAAKKHLPKNKFTFFKAVHPINYIWNFDQAFDSYMQSYNSGYRDGLRINHQVYSPQKEIKGGVMAGVDRYENHLRMVNEIQNEITSFRRSLREIEMMYKQQIDIAESTGFMEDYTDPLKQKYQTFAQKINELENMLQRHQSQLDQQSHRLESNIEIARDY